MSKRALISGTILLALVAGASLAVAATTARYIPAIVVDDHSFPIARTSWYSVINFRNDWHAPRMRFENGRWRQTGVHEGVDVYAEPGTPIRSITGGRVENIGWTFYSGWRVGVRGDDGRYWFYAHMQRFAPGLGEGKRVEAGTPLGEVGNTGYGEEPGHADEFSHHLHLGIQERDGSWSNPYPLLRSLYQTATNR